MNRDTIVIQIVNNKISWQQDYRYQKSVGFDYLNNAIIVEEQITNFDQANDLINQIKENLK